VCTASATAYAAWRPVPGRVIVALGLLGKILGPIGWAVAVGGGELPGRTLTLIVLDDVVWWIPFGLFVAEGARAAARLRGLAPALCAATNGLALVLMGLVLAPGTEIVSDAGARYRYIAEHHGLWSAGWAVWIAAALSLVGFYAWWASHLPRGWQPLPAVAPAALAARELASTAPVAAGLAAPHQQVPLDALLSRLHEAGFRYADSRGTVGLARPSAG
jgi:hypothetical protein